MRENNFRKIIWVIFFAFIFVGLLNHSLSYIDNDIGWHLQVGKDILDEKQVSHDTKYNYTTEGETWINHEWSIDAISYLIYENFGYNVLNVVFVLLMIIELLLLKKFLESFCPKKNDWVIIMLALFCGVVSISPHIGVRMQIITFLNFTLLLIIFQKYIKDQSIKTLFCLPILFFFWANLHAGFLLGLLMLWFFVVAKVLEFALVRYKIFSRFIFYDAMPANKIRNFSLFAIVSMLVTLLNPYGVNLHLFLADYFIGPGNYFLTKIVEWLPPYYYPLEYKQVFYFSFVLCVIILSLLRARKDDKYKINFLHICLALFFMYMYTKSVRHFPLFFIASLPLVMSFSSRFFDIPDNFSKKGIQNKIVKIFLVVAVCAMIFFSFNKLKETNFTNNPLENERYCAGYPCGAVSFIKNSEEYKDLRIFNDYSWGGFLIWAWPEKKLFIDGRMPQREFKGHSFLEEYFEFYKENKAQEKLNEYGVELVLLSKNYPIKLDWFCKYVLGLDEEEMNSGVDYFEEYLLKNWKIAYEDELGWVFVRND